MVPHYLAASAMPYHEFLAGDEMLHLIVMWFLSALALWLVSRMIPGFEVRDFGAALIAAAVIAVVNAIIGPIVKFLGFPLILLTLGLFLLVIDAFLLKLASLFTPGFKIRGFLPAVIGSVVLTILTWILRTLVFAW
jgi:putative membrane protein